MGNSMRIIAGDKKRLLLKAPKGDATRPTLAKVREALFMILADRVQDARVLDLFAGAGTLGLEALSRGATESVFVESAVPALIALRTNAEKMNCLDRAKIIRADALRFVSREPVNPSPFDLIIADPPYGKGLADEVLKRLADHSEKWLAAEGVVVAQVGRNDPLAESYGPLMRTDSRRYGQTRLDFFSRSS